MHLITKVPRGQTCWRLDLVMYLITKVTRGQTCWRLVLADVPIPGEEPMGPQGNPPSLLIILLRKIAILSNCVEGEGRGIWVKTIYPPHHPHKLPK